jgi:hypothetical protein
MTRAVTNSAEIRRDKMPTKGRLGTKATSGSWMSELSLGSLETIMQAVVRGTWSSVVTITEVTSGGPASITTTTTTIVGNTGSWITAGLQVGDVFRLTNHATAGNNSINLRITGLTASTITVAETITLNATPDTSFTITVAKRLINPAAGALVERYFTIEEVYNDLDMSEIYPDFKFGTFNLRMAADGIVMCEFGGIGTGQYSNLSGASSPSLTSPTETTSQPMSVVDASILINGAAMASLTSFDISMSNNLAADAVFGTAATQYSPDVFSGMFSLGVNYSVLRSDLASITALNSETQMYLHLLCVENESEPKDYISFFIPNGTIGDVQRSALSNTGGGMQVTVSIPPALVGVDQTGGAYSPTVIKVQSTGA